MKVGGVSGGTRIGRRRRLTEAWGKRDGEV